MGPDAFLEWPWAPTRPHHCCMGSVVNYNKSKAIKSMALLSIKKDVLFSNEIAAKNSNPSYSHSNGQNKRKHYQASQWGGGGHHWYAFIIYQNIWAICSSHIKAIIDIRYIFSRNAHPMLCSETRLNSCHLHRTRKFDKTIEILESRLNKNTQIPLRDKPLFRNSKCENWIETTPPGCSFLISQWHGNVCL